jgi:hypothetical protein
MPSPKPVLNAMLIADHAIREEGSGKISLIGIFSDINASSVPVVHPRLTVYVNIIDAEGPYKFRLDMVRLSDNVLLGRAEMDAEVEDRMRPTELLFEIGALVFERPGRYAFQFFADQGLVGGKTFSVVQMERPTGDA